MDWISVEERFPEDDSYILVSFENYDIPTIAQYVEDEEGGAFYPADGDTPYIAHGIVVNAWMPLPAPYRPDPEEDEKRTYRGRENKRRIVLRLEHLLKETRIGSGIKEMSLDLEESNVEIEFKSGFFRKVNVEGNSGYAIIKDVLRAL